MKKLSTILLISFLAVFLAAGSSFATTALYFDDLSDTTAGFYVYDGGTGDANPSTGAITFIGAVGSWDTNVTTGLTKPILGSAYLPKMDLNTVNVSSYLADPGGTINIGFYDDGFTTLGSTNFTASIGGTTNGTVDASVWVDYSEESTLGPFNPIGFSGSDSWTTITDGNYDIWLWSSITHGASDIIGGEVQGISTSFDFELKSSAVPEPATMLLLGSGLIGLAGIGRKKFFK